MAELLRDRLQAASARCYGERDWSALGRIADQNSAPTEAPEPAKNRPI